MKELQPELLVENLKFPEGPRWWDNQLWFSDVYGFNVYKMNADGSDLTVVAKFDDWPSGLGELPNGDRIVVEMRSQKIWRLPTGNNAPVLHADLAGLAVNEVNDMVTDAQGRSYTGCYGYDFIGGADPAPGKLILTDPDGRSRVVADGLMFPNGLAISEDGRTLTVAQTQGGEITAFDIGADGSLSNRRPWLKVPDLNPDGICLDAEGGMWIASVFTHEFFRVDAGGTMTHRIPTPGRCALAPMLGGADRRTLFLLTSDTDLERVRRGDMNGRIEVVDVDIPGAGLP